ncbi:MAG: AAA family ATPase [Proteobacteria bacterium]|nr:AAA family ATPase [Pseudomonadota bacterium]
MRILRVNLPPTKSFLLLGPRGTGKSTWLRSILPDALVIDLLDSSRFLKLSQNPAYLADLLAPLARGAWVIIDEIQRIPALLNEVHRLYESNGIQFALSGSSARKLRREGANLLAGRALQIFMFPFVFPEYRAFWTIDEACEWGSLPLVVSDPRHKQQTLATYVETYIKEEITAEALVRNLDPFIRVLHIAGLFNGQILNIENLARESAVKRTTIERYLQILEDTLLATRVPAIKLGIRTKETVHPKFFLFDTGMARAAAGLIMDEVDSIWKGFAFEALIFHEIRAYNFTSQNLRPIFHYAVSGSFDVDFILQTRPKTLSSPQQLIALEVKSSKRFKSEWVGPLNTLLEECGNIVKRAILIYRGADRLTIDGVEIWPVEFFLEELHSGKIF